MWIAIRSQVEGGTTTRLDGHSGAGDRKSCLVQRLCINGKLHFNKESYSILVLHKSFCNLFLIKKCYYFSLQSLKLSKMCYSSCLCSWFIGMPEDCMELQVNLQIYFAIGVLFLVKRILMFTDHVKDHRHCIFSCIT